MLTSSTSFRVTFSEKCTVELILLKWDTGTRVDVTVTSEFLLLFCLNMSRYWCVTGFRFFLELGCNFFIRRRSVMLWAHEHHHPGLCVYVCVDETAADNKSTLGEDNVTQGELWVLVKPRLTSTYLAVASTFDLCCPALAVCVKLLKPECVLGQLCLCTWPMTTEQSVSWSQWQLNSRYHLALSQL